MAVLRGGAVSYERGTPVPGFWRDAGAQPLGTFSRPVPRALWYRGAAVSYVRGTPGPGFWRDADLEVAAVAERHLAPLLFLLCLLSLVTLWWQDSRVTLLRNRPMETVHPLTVMRGS